jgi:hypothetical protein
VAVDVALHERRRLVHGDGDAQELDLLAVLRVQRLELRLQLLAVAAPGGPELEQHGCLTDVLRQVGSLSLQRLDRRRRPPRPDLDPGFLRAERHEERPQRNTHRQRDTKSKRAQRAVPVTDSR